jgi:hypothetical protein
MVRIDVSDTGIGIAEDEMPMLFEAFRQIDSSLTRTQGGTGLGLPIAKSLVEMQGGEMSVVSQVNVGSTFSVTLPTAPPEQDGSMASSQSWLRLMMRRPPIRYTMASRNANTRSGTGYACPPGCAAHRR